MVKSAFAYRGFMIPEGSRCRGAAGCGTGAGAAGGGTTFCMLLGYC